MQKCKNDKNAKMQKCKNEEEETKDKGKKKANRQRHKQSDNGGSVWDANTPLRQY
jgi:hypothetical protein